MNDMYYIVQHSAHAINTTLTAHIKAACIITNNSYMVATFNHTNQTAFFFSPVYKRIRVGPTSD